MLIVKPAMALFYAPKPTEKKENIARSNTMIVKMGLG
jgi:hypothetical protein